MNETVAGKVSSPPWLREEVDMKRVTGDITLPLEKRPGLVWALLLFIAMSLAGMLMLAVGWQFHKGLGILGIMHPVMWGSYIANFVFWVGIGHAGTLISAILLLFRQRWRNQINRTAEAMTVFAVMTAGLFPLIHLGRTWLAFWLIPYPNHRELWVNFRSPLIWDVFAVTTYLLVSLMFWYQGLIPDFATLRDKAKNAVLKFIYGTLALGWTGSSRDWNHYERAYWQFAWLATPLVLSVHSVVSFDFAVALVPGWHATIFPPYFVAGAIFSGMAMVVTLLVLMRKAFGLEEYITIRHLEMMNKVILLTSLMVGYAYAMEFFVAWYSEETYERFTFMNRLTGPYWPFIWTMLICNVFVPQVMWFGKYRRSIPVMFAVSIAVNVGMWLERFNIIVTSLSRDYLPASWGHYTMTVFDYAVLAGSFGFFFTFFLLFIRFFPTISMSETKMILSKPWAKGK